MVVLKASVWSSWLNGSVDEKSNCLIWAYGSYSILLNIY